jgi:hypothetical protein
MKQKMLKMAINCVDALKGWLYFVEFHLFHSHALLTLIVALIVIFVMFKYR